MKSLRAALSLWLADADNRDTVAITFGLLAVATVYCNPFGVLA